MIANPKTITKNEMIYLSENLTMFILIEAFDRFFEPDAVNLSLSILFEVY
jgi:hypothetical protein